MVQGMGLGLAGPRQQRHPLTWGWPVPGRTTPLTRGSTSNRCTGTNPIADPRAVTGMVTVDAFMPFSVLGAEVTVSNGAGTDLFCMALTGQQGAGA